MKVKLQLLMNELQLRPGQFARILEINPAIISHILAERNKPGVELLQKILSRFPQVSPDWLLLGTGNMFRETQSSVSTDASTNASSGQELFAAANQTASDNRLSVSDSAAAMAAASETPSTAPEIPAAAAHKSVVRIVVLYADGTFESFLPGVASSNFASN